MLTRTEQEKYGLQIYACHMPIDAQGNPKSGRSSLYLFLNFVANLVLLSSLPFLSGCVTASMIQDANTPTQTTLYNSAAKIDSAAITADNQLLIVFEKNPTNSSPNN